MQTYVGAVRPLISDSGDLLSDACSARHALKSRRRLKRRYVQLHLGAELINAAAGRLHGRQSSAETPPLVKGTEPVWLGHHRCHSRLAGVRAFDVSPVLVKQGGRHEGVPNPPSSGHPMGWRANLEWRSRHPLPVRHRKKRLVDCCVRVTEQHSTQMVRRCLSKTPHLSHTCGWRSQAITLTFVARTSWILSAITCFGALGPRSFRFRIFRRCRFQHRVDSGRRP